MPEWVLKYADPRGEMHQTTVVAGTESEVRDRYAQQGVLIYWIKPRKGALAAGGIFGASKKLDLEKFLIFNQQFVTLIRAGLPILKALDLLADRLTDPTLGRFVKAVRDEVKTGTLLSEAFRQQGIFPKMYVTSVMAGEKSGRPAGTMGTAGAVSAKPAPFSSTSVADSGAPFQVVAPSTLSANGMPASGLADGPCAASDAASRGNATLVKYFMGRSPWCVDPR